tara:strand:+ start:280 stop:396 length:117 start_codon:yes stop_codon:yes gene_type:complete
MSKVVIPGVGQVGSKAEKSLSEFHLPSLTLDLKDFWIK